MLIRCNEILLALFWWKCSSTVATFQLLYPDIYCCCSMQSLGTTGTVEEASRPMTPVQLWIMTHNKSLVVHVYLTITSRLFLFTDDMIAFWPLNEQFGGKNLIDNSINFHLYDITFSSAAANDSWKSPPAYFAGRSTSYAHLVDSPLLALSESFSWMAAFYQDLNTNGPLFEMDLGPGVVGPLIWIHQDRFFFGVNYPTCPRADQQDSESVTNGQWYTYAVAYDHSNKMFSTWKNGVLEQKQQPACAENPTHEGTVSIAIGKRYVVQKTIAKIHILITLKSKIKLFSHLRRSAYELDNSSICNTLRYFWFLWLHCDKKQGIWQRYALYWVPL